MTVKPDAKDDNRLRSYCLKYQVLNQENEESAYFLGDPEDGTKVAKMFQFGPLPMAHWLLKLSQRRQRNCSQSLITITKLKTTDRLLFLSYFF